MYRLYNKLLQGNLSDVYKFKITLSNTGHCCDLLNCLKPGIRSLVTVGPELSDEAHVATGSEVK